MLHRHLTLAACLLLAGASVSCFGPDAPAISSDQPETLVPAIKKGVAAHDRSIIPYLVKDLDNEDPAVRFYAIDGLQRLTGQDFGYRYYDDDEQRKPALARWKAWLAAHPS